MKEEKIETILNRIRRTLGNRLTWDDMIYIESLLYEELSK